MFGSVCLSTLLCIFFSSAPGQNFLIISSLSPLMGHVAITNTTQAKPASRRGTPRATKHLLVLGATRTHFSYSVCSILKYTILPTAKVTFLLSSTA